jgi:ABC-type transport system involved in multi-copper enzyme maturation permease subunit
MAAAQIVAIAQNTFKEAVRSRVFYILLAFAVSLLVFSTALGSLSIGNLQRVILDMGLSTISWFSAMTAIFIGIGLVYQEIEKKTIFNILSKPLSRTYFLLGRYAGLLLVLAANMVAMVFVLSVVLAFFGGFTTRIFSAAAYIYLELMILTAVALFFSSITSPVVSALCTVAFYVIGHTSSSLSYILVPLLEKPWVINLVMALYHLLPDLNILSINNLVVHDIPEAPGFAWRAVLYAFSMSGVLLLASILCFRRRDMV